MCFTSRQLRKMIISGKITGNTPVYAQGLDATPRCRPDGFLADDGDDEEMSEPASNSTAVADGDTVTSTSNGTTNMASGVQKPCNRAMSGWVPARRVVQLRWTIPELLNPSGNGGPAVSSSSASRTIGSSQRQNPAVGPGRSETVTGTEGIGSLVDQLGYSQGALLDYTTLAIRCVEVLRKLCDSCSSRDAHGGVVRPLPKPRRVISDSSLLNHVVQVSSSFVTTKSIFRRPLIVCLQIRLTYTQ